MFADPEAVPQKWRELDEQKETDLLLNSVKH
jgi:hypothetical protein